MRLENYKKSTSVKSRMTELGQHAKVTAVFDPTRITAALVSK